MRLKGWNIKHAGWLQGGAAQPLMRMLGWIELNVRWKQGGGDNRDQMNVSMDGHGPHSWVNWSPSAAWFSSMGEINKFNATCFSPLYFHIVTLILSRIDKLCVLHSCIIWCIGWFTTNCMEAIMLIFLAVGEVLFQCLQTAKVSSVVGGCMWPW